MNRRAAPHGLLPKTKAGKRGTHGPAPAAEQAKRLIRGERGVCRWEKPRPDATIAFFAELVVGCSSGWWWSDDLSFGFQGTGWSGVVREDTPSSSHPILHVTFMPGRLTPKHPTTTSILHRSLLLFYFTSSSYFSAIA